MVGTGGTLREMTEDGPTLQALAPALAFLAAVPIVALIHELGHALLARPAGLRVTSFGIGLGRPIARFRGPGGVVLTLRLWLFAGGACVAVPRGPGARARGAWFHAGGAIAQLVLGALLLGLGALGLDGPSLDAVQRFNLLVLAFNLVPWNVAGRASDGWWILQHLRAGRGGPGLLFTRRAELERLLRWEEEAESPVGVWYARLLLAWMDLQLRRLDGADDFFTREHAEAVLDPHLDALHHGLVAEWHRLRGRPLAALWVFRKLREARPDGLPPETEDLLHLVEGRTWLDLGELARAREALTRLAGVEGTAAADATVLRVEVALAAQDPDELRRAVRRVRLRAGSLDPVGATRTMITAADALSDDEDATAQAVAAAVAGTLRDRLVRIADAGDVGALLTAIDEPLGVAADG